MRLISNHNGSNTASAKAIGNITIKYIFSQFIFTLVLPTNFNTCFTCLTPVPRATTLLNDGQYCFEILYALLVATKAKHTTVYLLWIVTNESVMLMIVLRNIIILKLSGCAFALALSTLVVFV